MEWRIDPDVAGAFEFLRERLPHVGTSGKGLLLVGRFEVEYRGRAESRLAAGDRVVLVKSDGTLLIHNPDGLKPVNWQPAGGVFTCALADGRLLVEARRSRPVEMVRLIVDRVHLVGLLALEDRATLHLTGTEFDVRDALRARPELVEAGFVPWSKERITERGPMDLYGEDATGRRVVIEVKRVRAGLADATQLWRYVEKERSKRGVAVRGILVAPGVSERARLLLDEHDLEFRTVDWRSLRVEGARTERPEPTLASFSVSTQTKKV